MGGGVDCITKDTFVNVISSQSARKVYSIDIISGPLRYAHSNCWMVLCLRPWKFGKQCDMLNRSRVGAQRRRIFSQ